MLKILLILFIGIIIAACSRDIKKYTLPDLPPDQSQLAVKLADRLLVDLNRLEIPGLQIAVIKDDTLTELAIGTEDYQRNIPLKSSSLLPIGNITVTFTAAVILKLAEEKLLNLDDKLARWFSDFPLAHHISLRSLLNHTSGIYDFTNSISFKVITALNPNKIWQPADLYRIVRRGKPYFEPGSGYYFSNSNYLLLGQIAEKISGQEYSRLLSDIICQPLSLKNTFLKPSEGTAARLITGYYRKAFPLLLHKRHPGDKGWYSGSSSADGILSNAAETALFIHKLMSGELLKDEDLEMMLRFIPANDPVYPEQTGYGLGLRRLVIENDILWGHTSIVPGFCGAAFYCKERNYTIALLGNLSGLKETQLISNVVQTIQELEFYEDRAKSLMKKTG